MNRRRVVVYALLAAVVLAGGPWLLRAVHDELAHERAERAWPAQRGQLVAAVEGVRLPEAFQPVTCATPDGSRCWRTTGMPRDLVPALVDALTATGADDADDTCGPAPHWDAEPLGCTAVAALAGRHLTFAVVRDVDRAATDEADLLLGTSTVELTADLEEP